MKQFPAIISYIIHTHIQHVRVKQFLKKENKLFVFQINKRCFMYYIKNRSFGIVNEYSNYGFKTPKH